MTAGRSWGSGPGNVGLDGEMEQVFRDNAQAVHHVAERAAIGDHAAAEDATQEAFFSAFQNWPEFRQWSPDRQRAWLITCAKRRVIDGWRRVQQVTPTVEVPCQQVVPSAEEIVLPKLALEGCLRAISGMHPLTRKVAYLSFHEGWGNAEIARHLGTDPSTVSRHRKRAIAALRRQLGDEVPVPVSDENGEEAW